MSSSSTCTLQRGTRREAQPIAEPSTPAPWLTAVINAARVERDKRGQRQHSTDYRHDSNIADLCMILVQASQEHDQTQKGK